ncbi:integrase [Marinibacterium sp. SX1]|uniref:integrase n=1 Tax=Marinibacterium sp. SX1 TaxID=3388424 RepID=UPI003D1740AA
MTALSAHTAKAYAADWAHFARWCRLTATPPLPPSPDHVAAYLAGLAAPSDGSRPLALGTIERRLAGLAWNYGQRGMALDRAAPPIAEVMAGLRRRPAPAPTRKAAITADDIRAMLATLPFDLRGIRDRAILLLGFAGHLRRSEIVSLDIHSAAAPGPNTARFVDGPDGPDSGGVLVTLATRHGPRDIAIGRGSTDLTCPVHALDQWLHFARIDAGPIFRRSTRDGKRVLDARQSDKHVARLIKHSVLKSGIRADLPEAARLALFSGQSLRAALAGMDDRPAVGAPADRFRDNLTRAAGL